MARPFLQSLRTFLRGGFAILLLAPIGSAETPRKRVSVMDFEFGTVQRWWDGNWDIGRGISDLLVDRLLSEGTFRVIERRKLDAVLAEQNFSTSERADSSSAARIGKVLGVNAIILGSVTQFGTEKKDFNAGGIGGGRAGLGAGKMGTREGKASVGITARIIDINTGEVLASSTGRGQSSRSGLLLGGLVIGRGGFGAGTVNMNSSQFRETILGEATYAAVNDLSRQLNLFAHKVPSSSQDIRGLVADVSGNNVILNVGRSHGLEAGTTLNVLRVDRTVKDPATGKPLRQIVSEVGRVRVDEADNDSSIGTIISGTGIKLGDVVRTR
jgi:curli biogenesis system outer membrane secretion channel CsgG